MLELLQLLRRRRRPVAAAALARETGVSLRTVHRDLATLIAQGAVVEEAPGLGYVLRQDDFLPPLAFGPDEVDALILGLRFVAGGGDADLAGAAEDALARIVAVLPPASADIATASEPIAGAGNPATPHLTVIREAIRAERRLALRYADRKARATERTVWPVAVGFFAEVEMLAAWCELRADFRHFRLDRIAEARVLADRYPTRRPPSMSGSCISSTGCQSASSES